MKRSLASTTEPNQTEDPSPTSAPAPKKRTRMQKPKAQDLSDVSVGPLPHGQIRIDRLPPRFAKGISKKWPVVAGFKNVNVCSSAPGFWKELSPMLLGPIPLRQWGIDPETDRSKVLHGVSVPEKCLKMENVWQFSKVFVQEVGSDKWPNAEFFRRRSQAWKDPKGHRHSIKGARVEYFLWGESKFTYVEARKRIYCPIYASIVQKTRAYKELVKLLEQGQNVQILGYDGYDRGDRTWEECLNDLSRPFGHEMVLGALLEGSRPWEDTVEEIKNVE